MNLITASGETLYREMEAGTTIVEVAAPELTHWLDLYMGDAMGSRVINGPDGQRRGNAIHQWDECEQ